MFRPLRSAIAEPELLKVELADDRVLELPWFWVRDHGHDEASRDPDTLQRRVDTAALDLDVGQGTVVVAADGSQLTVSWPDGGSSTVLDGAWLAAIDTPPAPMSSWSGDLVLAPAADFPTLMADDATLAGWLADLARSGFGLVDDVTPSEEGARQIAERLGYVRRTIFGDVWELAADVTGHADTAYGTTFLGPHTDSTYNQDAPGFQLFVCAERDGTGGESFVVDGLALWDRLRSSDAEAARVLSTVAVPGRYIDAGVDLIASRPPFRLDGQGRFVQISLNNYDRDGFLLPPAELRRFYEAWQLVLELAADESHWVEIGLRPGQALLIDNWRVLHGRRAYTGTRRFWGCYLNHEDVESTARALRR
ncbi:MAG: hypothetical protein GY929_18715 [Actinomycetia bacterium]|nr:hypothetical protein [Actinomycetes bacterium]